MKNWCVCGCERKKIVHHRSSYAAILGCHIVLWQLYQEFQEQTMTSCRTPLRLHYLPCSTHRIIQTNKIAFLLHFYTFLSAQRTMHALLQVTAALGSRVIIFLLIWVPSWSILCPIFLLSKVTLTLFFFCYRATTEQ